jgi:hypothetical protein
LQRLEDVSTPDELSDAQTELIEAFRLRADGLAGISDDISLALAASPERAAAIDRMVDDMKGFLASDVLYERASAQIADTLAEQDVSAEIPPSVFLPEPSDPWLDTNQLATTLNAFATGTGDGTHGLALLSTEIDKTPLTPNAENTVNLGSDPPELKIQVENQGQEAETGVTVSYELTGGAVPFEGDEAISKLDSGGNTEITVPLSDLPEANTPMTLVINVLPVPDEVDSSNNTATYTVTFQ